MEKRNFNEALKNREERQREENARRSGENEMTLDDAARVKILSPGQLVFKRFIRNKLALVGSAILILMFLFAFLGPLFYQYDQKQVFTTYKPLNAPYANAKERTEFTVYTAEDRGISIKSKNLFNSVILQMQGKKSDQYGNIIEAEEGFIEQECYVFADEDGKQILVEKTGENIYTMSVADTAKAATFTPELVGTLFNKNGKPNMIPAKDAALTQAAIDAMNAQTATFVHNDVTYQLIDGANQYEKKVICIANGATSFAGQDLGQEFAAAAMECVLAGRNAFGFDGKIYAVSAAQLVNTGVEYSLDAVTATKLSYVASPFVFDTVTAGQQLSDAFKVNALLAIYGEGTFTADDANYTVTNEDGMISINTADGEAFAAVSTFVVRRFNGEDSLELGFKQVAAELVEKMEAEKLNKATFKYNIPQLDESGKVITDDNGDVKLVETELTVTNKVTDYDIRCEQYTSMIDRFAAPSDEHILGTDGDGMDIFARMMAGGRVSLLVGFVVVILEIILGVIMGGLAGYFGGWVDNLIMRLVDIFYCIPSMPILIIIGAMLDELRLEPYVRLMWLMAVLGFLGWAGIARLVRGQILSLRDQDFMVATEATGLPVRRRIFRHLVPNVMPQLIVTATAGLGSVILTESTLSFLGLGVKHPMATWGTMINSVATSAQSMITYTYIWIPVGLLICLTVIAFNFVGDGLRDAFDPKMKR